MYIKHITIRNLGSVKRFDADLDSGLNIIQTGNTPEVAAAIETILCNHPPEAPCLASVREDTQIMAEVSIGEKTFFAAWTPDNLTGRLQLKALDAEEKDATWDYFAALSHCPEEDAVGQFDGQDKSLPGRLGGYCHGDDPVRRRHLAERINHIAATRTFRSRLIKYIRNFAPEPIHCKKAYQLAMQPNGEFDVFCPGVSRGVLLSETEEKLFLYMCFLNIAAFWKDIEDIRDFHHTQKPLLIQNFLEFLDESVEIANLISRTLRLQRQVIMITLPLQKTFLTDGSRRKTGCDKQKGYLPWGIF